MTAITIDDYVRSSLDANRLKDETTTAATVDYLRKVVSTDPEGDHSVGLNDAGEPMYEPAYLGLASLVAAFAKPVLGVG